MLINACCIHCCLSRINSLFSLYYANMLIKWNQNFWMMFKISLAVRSKLTRCLRARQNFWLFSELKSPWNHNWRFLFFMEFSLINLINVLLYCLIFNIFYLYVCMLSLAINTGHTANVFFYITRVLLSNDKNHTSTLLFKGQFTQNMLLHSIAQLFYWFICSTILELVLDWHLWPLCQLFI